MIKNSGFFSNEDELTRIKSSFSEVAILGCSSTNVYGSVNRYGKRWFFKGVRADAFNPSLARQQLLKEFDIQVGLVHPSVARIIGFENIEGVGECIIAEWIEGETLADVIKKSALNSAERLCILSEIIEAVGYLHSQGIVHRDLKPSNIMIRKNGQTAVVVDFGLADTDAHLYQKLPGGTEGYASPRQHVAHTPFTGDDIHALGVIMAELCPNLSSIARRCRIGKYATAEALRRAIERQHSRRRIISRVSVAAALVIIFAALFVYIFSLQNTAEGLRSEVKVMADSITSLHSNFKVTNLELRDSLVSVGRQLDNERGVRIANERHSAQIKEFKSKLKQRLEKAFADFCKTDVPANRDNFNRLVERLGAIKTDFFEEEINITLSDSELNDLELSFSKYFSDILNKWAQRSNQYRQSRSED